MLKLILPGSWDFHEAATALVKRSSRGIRGEDRRQLLKRASAGFVDQVSRLDWPDDMEPVHILAVGSEEGWGPNRNGDGFPEADNRKYHQTFVKFARVYKDHLNKDPKRSYGIVKASAYHDEMRRIELLGLMAKTAEAARRIGGLVNHKALEKLARGEDLPWSMSCLVNEDVCDICGNVAQTRDDYCDEKSCPGGGCKTNLGRIAKDGSGRVQFVHNYKPRYVDISEVDFPAERTAYGCRLSKAASGSVMGGAELAEVLGVSVPKGFGIDLAENPVLEGLSRAHRVLAKMATYEAKARQAGASRIPMGGSSNSAVLRGRAEKSAGEMASLARHRILIPLLDFLQAELPTEKAASMLERVYRRIPGMYGRLADDPTPLRQNPYSLLNPATAQKSAAVSGMIEKKAFTSLDPAIATRRLQAEYLLDQEKPMRAAPTGDDPEAESLVMKFAAVRVLMAAVTAEESDGDQFLQAAVRED